MPENMLVKGTIVFEGDVKPFSGATAHIRLEDVSLQDAPSKLIAEQVVRNVTYDSIDRQKIQFVFYRDGIVVEVNARYSIKVHIDVDNDGKLSKGDFITTQSYPVLTYGYPNNLSVIVKELK